MIHFFDGKKNRTGQDLIIVLGFRSLVARLVPFERGGTKPEGEKFFGNGSVNSLRILDLSAKGETGSVKGETKSANFWQGKV